MQSLTYFIKKLKINFVFFHEYIYIHKNVCILSDLVTELRLEDVSIRASLKCFKLNSKLFNSL